MPTVTRFSINRAGMNQTLKGRRGPVVLHLANVGRQAAAIARRTAPRGDGPGPHLADNISSKLVPSLRGGYAVQLVAGVPHAIYVVKGTRPHDIGSPVLIGGGVGWRYIGRSPAGRGKMHPGTKANPFMQRAVASLGLRVRTLG